ncbi:DNA ligase D [Ginsengibacter hankyongi]|uniref:DNA ligase (ATP) n=2 Tax=Ginsengibacter hankyongi TaxID=2607284 RepID=A0A5J5IGG9_9BACT|nr:DNA ligase D [Ginsengibacter hankyongi]
MLATLVDKPFDGEGWLYEVKWDGYRAIAYLNNGRAELQSRNDKSFNDKFYPVYNSLTQWKINAVLDGEIIVSNDKGISNFSKLQNWRSEADGELIYYLFDILWLDGKDLTQLPLTERREILKSIEPSVENIRISESFNAGATEFFEVAKKLELEGIIAKKTASKYYPGQRSKEWLKIKTSKRQEVIIGGYTHNEDSSKLFSSLLVGVFDNGKLQYTGKIGTGFSDKLQKEMMKQFKPLIIKESPFTFIPDVNKPSRFRPNPSKATATWLQPKLICEVSYAEMTTDGVMRHPSFEGMREDKSAIEVVREKEKHTEDVVNLPKQSLHKKRTEKLTMKKKSQKTVDKSLTGRLIKTSEKTERKTLLNPTEKSQTKNINGHSITFNNLNKIYFPKKKVTKRDVINYYYLVAPYMLPYMKDRPQTLIRYPNGIDGKSFYQKDVTGKVPEWIRQFPYSSERGGDRNFLVCTDEASLLLIASMGGLEMHPWSSRIQKPDHPDWCILDLDPSDKTSFKQVITAAQTIKQVLDAIDVTAYCKTSGATGIHIYIPLGAKYTYEQSKEFGRVLVKIVHSMIPDFTSIERIIENRKERLYLDFLQNRPQATLAAPYSLRPKQDATVSMPLLWDEVNTGLQMKDFTIFNAVERIHKHGDIFKGVLGKGINLKSVLKKINKVFGPVEMHESLKT